MVSTASLIDHLDAVLNPQRFEDLAPNGLQVPGRDSVRRVATGVTASASLHERAIEQGADLVLVHHGIFWEGMPRHVDAALHGRLRPLMVADVGLAAYHLPLDAHPEVGNNALLARELAAEPDRQAFGHRGVPIGLIARLPGEGVAPEELVARVASATQREPLAFLHGPERVRTVGIVTGGGASYLGEAIAEGVDAFLTGEPAERVMAQSREAGVHFLAAGHYATETFGVRALGDLLHERFGVEHLFLDDPNPV